MPEESFHNRLPALMLELGISQKAVAHALNVSRYTVRRWCKSKMPDQNQLATLAAFLHTTVPHLLNGDQVDADHAALCHRLYSLATDLDTRDVETFIDIFERLLATKKLQTSTG
ncbi:helix-turn-helix domain-containing protein [Chromobacterium violaceum]|uniref:helix-turn-helix domain-containing protein n=1 Tax=Chromobacterium violaceum TaxID=536 RepID=UPI0039B37C25